MTKLSKNFKYREFIKSEIADKLQICNEPNLTQLNNIQALVDNVLQPVRDLIDAPITITSGFRSKALNIAIKGSTTSQHCANNGAAVDIECFETGNKILFDLIRKNFNFDQLIWEFGDENNPDWVHVSYVNETSNRNQVLKAIKSPNGDTRYIPFK